MRAIVIEGAGVAFSSGHDLREMVGRDLPFYQRLFDVCIELMETIHRVPQPVIAKVHGSRPRRAASWSPPATSPSPPTKRVRDTRRQDRPLLLDADGAALARDRPQAGARAAPHRRAHLRRHGTRLGARQPRRPARRARRRRRRAGRRRSRRSSRSPSRSARRPSTRRSSSTRAGRTTSRGRSWP